jgi:hypothetical protein
MPNQKSTYVSSKIGSETVILQKKASIISIFDLAGRLITRHRIYPGADRKEGGGKA